MVTGPLIDAFLASHGWQNAKREPLPGDASARSYQRLHDRDRRALLMLTPDEGMANDFIAVAKVLQTLGLSAPQVLAADAAAGLVLVEDFGDATFTALLDAGAAPMPLYELAVDVLIHIHVSIAGTPDLPDLPRFDAALFLEQTMLFCDVAMTAKSGPFDGSAKADFRAVWHKPLALATAVPNSLLLRDFHAGNLLHLPNRPSVQACGLIDFQDAGIGPITYDLVSLLQDARRDVGADVTQACLARYQRAFPDLDLDQFETSYAVLSVQRHIRVIAIFNRLSQQGKPGYLEHLPRLWRLLAIALRHPALRDVADWFAVHAPAPVEAE